MFQCFFHIALLKIRADKSIIRTLSPMFLHYSFAVLQLKVLEKLQPTTIYAQNLETKNLQINHESAERYLYHALKKEAKDLILTIAKDIKTLKPKRL